MQSNTTPRRRLLIVESPNKVKKLQAMLDEGFGAGSWRVVATVGHWRGLPAMNGQKFTDVVDSESWVERFEVQKRDVAARLRAAIADAGDVYLATDPDREGEAIAWHVIEAFTLSRAKRALLHELTRPALMKGINEAGVLDQHLAAAQRARQVLDYAIGMEVSRRLWPFGVKSAGRVQSAALRIVVTREESIEAFKPSDYWTVSATYAEGFTAVVGGLEVPSEDEADESGDNERAPSLKPKRFASALEAKMIVEEGRAARHVVERIVRKQRTRRPPPPFTTASLQAEAAAQLSWDAERTARVAQSLFEQGLVTYVRTDSVALSQDAIDDIRGFLASHHPALLPEKPQRFSDKSGAQGAHEAIRPTRMANADAARLSGDEASLYRLIWLRALMCQAKSAELAVTTMTIRPGAAAWRLLAVGTTIIERGFLALDKAVEVRAAAEDALPSVRDGATLSLTRIEEKRASTKAPARFTQASLIRYLERKGIGRPSTYAAIMKTLLGRGYVERAGKYLAPAKTGRLADRLTRGCLNAVTDEGFTAKTEARLDAIAAGDLSRPAFLTEFYGQLVEQLKDADAYLAFFAKSHPELVPDSSLPSCPACDAPMRSRTSARGPFYGCSRFPSCTTTLPTAEMSRSRTAEMSRTKRRMGARGSTTRRRAN